MYNILFMKCDMAPKAERRRQNLERRGLVAIRGHFEASIFSSAQFSCIFAYVNTIYFNTFHMFRLFSYHLLSLYE